MMKHLPQRVGAALAALTVATLLFAPADVLAQSWGTVKGQVVWAGGAVPELEKANVDKDQAHCLSKGPILKNNLIVNKSNKGVRYVLVWLADAANPKSTAWKAPIHPSLKALKPTVEIDQPCCMFEPRVLGIREGQALLVKNTAPVAHNFSITSIGDGPNGNWLTPSGSKPLEVSGFKAKLLPTVYSCSIHSWMKGFVGVFSHPYFAVTDEDGNFELKNVPAGKHRLMAWQEEAGWVIVNPMLRTDRGKIIEVKAGGTTEVQVPLKVASN